MKNIKDILESEGKDKKDKKKPESKLKPGQGEDDKKYVALMSEYKSLRRNPKNKKKCDELLQKAFKLGREGDVSSDAKLGAAYL